MEDINLDKNQKYTVELYPGKVRVEGRYLGKAGGNHVFENQGPKEKNYLLVEDQWIEQREGAITHQDISSFAVKVVSERDTKIIKGLEEVIESK